MNFVLFKWHGSSNEGKCQNMFIDVNLRQNMFIDVNLRQNMFTDVNLRQNMFIDVNPGFIMLSVYSMSS
jgi:hypothetical protein